MSNRRAELDRYGDGAQVRYTRTRSQPPGRTGYTRRVDAALAGLGYPAERVKTARFGQREGNDGRA